MKDNAPRCPGNSAIPWRRLSVVGEVGVEGSVDLAVDFLGDLVEASQEALEASVVDPMVAMEDPLGAMEDPAMEVVMEEARSVGEGQQLD